MLLLDKKKNYLTSHHNQKQREKNKNGKKYKQYHINTIKIKA